MLRKTWEQIRELWQQMSLGQKSATVFAVIAVVGTILMVSTLASRPQWGLLYSDIGDRDGGDVIAKLQEWDVSYELRAGGRQVWVERERVTDMKMRLSEAGVTPVSDLGYTELFDQGASSFGRTEFQNQVTLTRAQQGELSQMLKKLPFILDADVMIAKPQPTLFVEERKPVTTSVMVVPKYGRLSSDQVFALANYVAASVPGLEPENVMLVDSRGRALNSAENSGRSGAGGQLDVQRALEETLVTRAMDQLFAMVGADKASVQVTAQLEFERSAETIETVDAESGVPSREKIRTETMEGVVSAALTGVDAVLTNDNVGRSGGNTSTTEDSEIDYLYGRTTRKVERDGATVKRLTVSVVADKAFEDRATEIETLVRNAVGFESARGDEISVAFSEAFVVPEPAPAESPGFDFNDPKVQTTLETVGAIVALFLLFMLVRPVLKRSMQSVTPPARPLIATEGVAGAIGAGAIGADGTPQVTAGESTYHASPTAQLTELIDADPEKVANIMKNWVAKEEV